MKQISVDNTGYGHYQKELRPTANRAQDVLKTLVKDFLDNGEFVADLETVADRTGARIDNPDWGLNNLSPNIKKLQLAGAVCKVETLADSKRTPILIDERITRDLAPLPSTKPGYPSVTEIKRFLGSADLRRDGFREDPWAAAAKAWLWAELVKFTDPVDAEAAPEVAINFKQFGNTGSSDQQRHWTADYPFTGDLIYDGYSNRYAEYATRIDIEYENLEILADAEGLLADALLDQLLDFHATSFYASGVQSMHRAKARNHLKDSDVLDSGGNIDGRIPYYATSSPDWMFDQSKNQVRIATLYQDSK